MSAAAGKLGELLLREGLITEDQLTKALEHQTKNKTRLGNSLVQLGHINERVLATFLSKQFGMQAISLEGVKIPPDLVKLIPRNLCEKHTLIPLAMVNGKLVVAMLDPTNVTAVDDLRFLCNTEIVVYLSTQSAIKNLIDAVYSQTSPKELQNKMQDELAKELEVIRKATAENKGNREVPSRKKN